MNQKPLILIGGRVHCKSVIDTIESICRNIKCILDLPIYFGEKCLGYQVIGSDSDIAMFVDESLFIFTLGFIKNSEHRIHLHRLIEHSGGRLTAVIASSAHV